MQVALINIVTPILTAILTIFAALAIAKIQVYNNIQDLGMEFYDASLDDVVYIVFIIAVFIEIIVLYNLLTLKKELSISEDACNVISGKDD